MTATMMHVFIYVDHDWYLSIDEKKDYIESPIADLLILTAGIKEGIQPHKKVKPRPFWSGQVTYSLY
jgi:hypothetical protein